MHRPALLHNCCERKARKFSSIVARLAQSTPAELAHAAAPQRTPAHRGGGASGGGAGGDERARLRQKSAAKRRKMMYQSAGYFHRALQHLAGTMGSIAVRLVGNFRAAASAPPPEDQSRLVSVSQLLLLLELLFAAVARARALTPPLPSPPSALHPCLILPLHFK